MTLGLAYGDENTVYAAIDGYGTSKEGLARKVISLANGVIVLAAGGMYHWRDAIAGYTAQNSVEDAATVLASLLDKCMQPSNQAFGLVCGFEETEPVCYRIDRFVGKERCEKPKRENLRTVRSIGGPQGVNPHEVASGASRAIQAGEPELKALVDAIEASISRSSEVARPIETEELHRNG